MADKLQHHAFFLRSSGEKLPLWYLTQLNLPSDDIYWLKVASLGITEVRNLSYQAALRPQSGSSRTVVVIADEITVPAQQAFLKTLEEPAPSTIFLLVIPEKTNLLPTVLSRLHEVRLLEQEAEPVDNVWQEFVSSTYRERLEEISKRLNAKDDVWLRSLKSGLELELSVVGTNNSKLKQRLQLAMNELGRAGAANKMLLEDLALSLDDAKIKP